MRRARAPSRGTVEGMTTSPAPAAPVASAPWRTVEAVLAPVLVFVAASAVVALAAVAWLVAGALAGAPPSTTSLLVWLGVVGVPLLTLAGVIGWFAARHGRAGLAALWRPFGDGAWRRRSAVAVAVAGGLLWVVVFDLAIGGLLTSLIEVPEQQVVAQLADAGGVETVGLLAGVAVLAPLWEEVVFRGLLFAALARRFGFWPAALLSSALFAALHFEGSVALFAVATPQLLLFGVAMCWLLQRTGSLAAPIVFHAVHNAAVAAVVLAA